MTENTNRYAGEQDVPNIFAPATHATMFSKNYIRDQVKIGRFNSLIEQGELLDYFRRIIEEINARNYSGLLTLSYEFRLVLSVLDKMLDRKAHEVFRLDPMPKSCELQTLRMILSPTAKDKKLVCLSGERELDDGEVREFYFTLFSDQPGGDIIGLVNELGLRRIFDYIWDKGLHKYFNSRYRSLRGVPEDDLDVEKIIEEIGLPALFDESSLIKHYSDFEIVDDKKEIQDLKNKLSHESAVKAKANIKLDRIYGMLAKYPCDFWLLRKAMLDFKMDLVVESIEQGGINCLKDYIRSKAVMGAREIASRYDFIYPVVSDTDMAQARRVISSSFFAQAQKTRKGKYFLRTEVLYNLKPIVKNGECYKLPGGYLLAVIRLINGEEHYLFGRYPSRTEKDAFNLAAIGFFYLLDSPMKAVARLVKYHMDSVAPNVRTNNALKKMLVAFPMVLIPAILVGIFYYMTLGGLAGAILVGGGIMFIGMAIAGKNGYDEEVTPASHEKIPGYLARKGGKVTATVATLESGPQEPEEKQPKEKDQ